MDKGSHKKVGVLTYHTPNNYGAVLQTLALKEVLERFGQDVVVVNYATDAQLRINDFLRFNGTVKSVLNIILSVPNYFRLKNRNKKFDAFRNRYFPLTRRYASKSDFLKDLPKLDAIISGSDQVFQVWEDKELSVYYLPFYGTSINKIAYAPSFGRSVFTSVIDEKIAKALTDFNILSCRENIGAKHIYEITGKECQLVVDPVLLVGEIFWANICKLHKSMYKDYILIFDLLGGPYLVKLAKQLNKGKNLEIICITTKRFLKRPYHVDKLIWDASPLEFVGWIKGASYVLTDSFHGSAFATIFEKPLVSLIINEHASDRLETLLSYFGAKDKLLNRQMLSKRIDVNDYLIETHPTPELKKAIDSSRNFLINALKNI